MNLEDLLKQAKEEQYRTMIAGNYPASFAYGYGEIIAEKVNWSPDLDLHDLLVRSGGDIHYVDYPTFHRHPGIFTNSIFVRNLNDFDIILPAYGDMMENRFTLAHELGHYVLHAKQSGKSFALRNGDTLVEKQADCFALGFLMPSERFRTATDQFKTEFELSLAFRVPIFAARARLESLGLALNQK